MVKKYTHIIKIILKDKNTKIENKICHLHLKMEHVHFDNDKVIFNEINNFIMFLSNAYIKNHIDDTDSIVAIRIDKSGEICVVDFYQEEEVTQDDLTFD